MSSFELSMNMPVFELWEEGRAPSGNLCKHVRNVQMPRRTRRSEAGAMKPWGWPLMRHGHSTTTHLDAARKTHIPVPQPPQPAQIHTTLDSQQPAPYRHIKCCKMAGYCFNATFWFSSCFVFELLQFHSAELGHHTSFSECAVNYERA